MINHLESNSNFCSFNFLVSSRSLSNIESQNEKIRTEPNERVRNEKGPFGGPRAIHL